MIEIAASPSEPTRIANAAHAHLPHVLLVLDEFPKALGGAEVIALRLAALLPQYGFRASILTFSVYPNLAELKSPPCPIYLLPITRTYDLTALRAARELARFIKQQNIQIVNTFFESSDIWAGLVTRAATSAKLIWSRRDMGILRSPKHNLAYRLMASAPHAVFAVSNQVGRHCIEVDHIDPARVHTIYNGLDLSNWDTNTRPLKAPGESLITTVGHIRPVKGHDIFIKAAAAVLLRFPNVTFSIAGDVLEQDYFAELQALILDLGLSNNFRFEGPVSNLRQHLAKADIFVLPSRSEGFSNAIIEAMAASLPAVVTNVGGNAEAVQDGINGFVVPSEDPSALSAAILQLLSDPPLAQAMGSAGRTLANDKFTTRTMLSETAAAYRRVLEKK